MTNGVVLIWIFARPSTLISLEIEIIEKDRGSYNQIEWSYQHMKFIAPVFQRYSFFTKRVTKHTHIDK